MIGCVVPFTSLGASCGKMLSKNHFAELKRHIFWVSFIQFSFAWPNTILLSQTNMFWFLFVQFSIDGQVTQWAPVELKKMLFRHPPQKRSNNYQVWQFPRSWNPKSSLCAEVSHMHSWFQGSMRFKWGLPFQSVRMRQNENWKEVAPDFRHSLHIWISCCGAVCLQGRWQAGWQHRWNPPPLSPKWFRSLSVSTPLSMQTQMI